MFDNLRTKWITQSDQFKEWKRGLRTTSIKLKMALSEKLGAKDLVWDSANHIADSKSAWTKDENEMINRIIKLLDLQFSFDPRDGMPQKTGIGFIKN